MLTGQQQQPRHHRIICGGVVGIEPRCNSYERSRVKRRLAAALPNLLDRLGARALNTTTPLPLQALVDHFAVECAEQNETGRTRPVRGLDNPSCYRTRAVRLISPRAVRFHWRCNQPKNL